MLITFLLHFLLFCIFFPTSHCVYEWSFQQKIRVSEAGNTYGKTPSYFVGRGFTTLVTGYNYQSPGIYIHTCDDGYVKNSQPVWSQQAKLVPSEGSVGDNFGVNMVALNTTLIVSAPNAFNRRGYLYVFNGTLRHWSQIQRILPTESYVNDYFGEQLSLHKNRLIASARGYSSNSGAVHVYERNQGGLYWSRQCRLLPRDLASSQYFGERLSLYGTTAVVTARNDDYSGDQTGSAYIFQGSAGAWSQQQKLIALEMEYYRQKISLDKLDLSLGDRTLGRSISITSTLDIVVGVTNTYPNITNQESVYIFSTTSSSGRWSIQQKLWQKNDSDNNIVYGTDVYTDRDENLFATSTGPNISTTYVFKTYGNGWSIHSKINSFNATTDGLYYKNDFDNTINYNDSYPPVSNFSNPTLWGDALIHTAQNDIQIRRRMRNDSCLLIWLSDHFLDGWDTAVLTVRAPDLTNDTFHPHCDQVDPFLVRYCPKDVSESGVYIIKVFAATSARFFWEISWQVMVESTGKWYRGDFATKMMFNFDSDTSTFSLVETQNLVDLSASCYRCTTIALRSWSQMQSTGDSSFWPLVVYGAPYYISDYQGKVLYASGKVCNGVSKYECYQSVTDGVYTLRLGGGLFGRLTGFPYSGAYWEGCGKNGTYQEQFVFQILNGQCKPLQIYDYTTRCAQPSAVSGTSSTKAPTYGGTQAPTQSVYGNTYIKGQMYVNRNDKDKIERIDDNMNSFFEKHLSQSSSIDSHNSTSTLMF